MTPTDRLHSLLSRLQAALHAEVLPGLRGGAPDFDALVAEHLPRVGPELDALYAELGELDARLTVDDRDHERARHRILVQPFFLQAAIARWAVDKPLGYPGDFKMVDILFDPPPRERTPTGALLAAWSHASGPPRSHRARRPWALARLAALAAAVGERPLRLLSFACGPERVLRGSEELLGARGLEITLCDADPRALAHAERHLRRAGTTVRGHALSVRQLLRDPQLLVDPRGGYDGVLVLGLLDYLTDAAARRLLAALAQRLRPGGELLLSNLHVVNPWRAFMEYTLDWVVRHRDLAGLADLAPPTIEPLELHPDPAAGTNLLFAGRRRG